MAHPNWAGCDIPIAETLGWDVALVRGDYSSIVGYFTNEAWAEEFRDRINRHGLFDDRRDAEEYLAGYRQQQEHDWEQPFDVIFVERLAIV